MQEARGHNIRAANRIKIMRLLLVGMLILSHMQEVHKMMPMIKSLEVGVKRLHQESMEVPRINGNLNLLLKEMISMMTE